MERNAPRSSTVGNRAPAGGPILKTFDVIANETYELSFKDITEYQYPPQTPLFNDYRVLIYKINPNQTEAILLDQSFNLAQATKLITFIPTSDKIRIEIRYMNSDIGRFSTIDDIKLRRLDGFTTVYTNSFSSTVMTTNALDGWQPDSWNTTSATLDYAGGNHRLVAIGSNATATVQRDFATNANEQHSLSYNLALINGGSATVKVQQKVGNTYYDLAGSTQTHTASGTYNFNFTPTEDDIRVVVNGNSRYALTQIFMDRNTIEEVVETYTLSAGGYRYGFNGMEKDDEAKGRGNSYDFGARFYDSRLGRWLSRDAVEAKKPDLSPYQSFKNNPLLYNDPDGNDEFISIVVKDHTGKSIGIIRGHEAVSNKVRAGAITEAGNSTTIYESQKFYDFRRVHTVTIKEDGSLDWDPKPSYHTLLDRPRGSKTMLFSSISGYRKGSIVDPSELKKGFDLNLEGSGGSQDGGYHFVTPDGGASRTKQRPLNDAEQRDIEDLLTYFGTGQKPLFGDLPTGTDALPDVTEKFKSLVEELGGGGSTSNEIKSNKPNSTPSIPVSSSNTNQDTTITIKTVERGYGWYSSTSKDTTVKKSEVQNVNQKREVNRNY